MCGVTDAAHARSTPRTPPCRANGNSALIVVDMERFLVPPVAACVLAVAVLSAVMFVGVWISIGGSPWARFRELLEWVTVMRR